MRRAGVVLLIWGCGGVQMGTLQNEREIVGDTVVVRTLAGSVWDGPRVLEPELRIGVLEGEDEYVFGQIQGIAVDAARGIYVFDGQVPALRYYDASGQFVRQLGRDGAGPGEYRNAALGLAIRSDGRIVLRDPRNARLTVFNPDGTFHTQWPVASGLFTGDAFVIDTADHMYLRVLTGPIERGRNWPVGLEHRGPDGAVVDTIVPPHLPGELENSGGFFLPRKAWVWSPLGYLVVGLTSEYRVDLRRPRAVVRIERRAGSIPVHPDERAAYEARNDWMRENQGQFLSAPIPPVPSTKTPWRGLMVGEDGRVWVLRSRPGERIPDPPPAREGSPPPVGWREPPVYDVFEPDGTYLGEVRVPGRTTLYGARGAEAWGVQHGEFDEQYFVRFRIAVPGGG